jgi:uncharacterized membrane protein
VWWGFLFLLGLVALPLTQVLLGRFEDQGYPFSKVIGLGTAAYLSWLASSMGALPLCRWTALVLVGALGAVAFASRRRRSRAVAFLASRRASVARQEGLLLALLGLWAFVRGLQPDIRGQEKFMDHGFAASIVRSGFMPPQDMWFAGESVNYYYFGHYVLAFLSELTGVRLSVAYNLMVGTVLALCFTLTLALAAQVVRTWKGSTPRQCLLAGLASAALLTFGGNLHTATFALARPALEAMGAVAKSPPEERAGGYWYVEATRYVGYRPPTDDKTIHEFPFYSFVVSDLHAHVSNIPFVLTLLAFLTAAFFGHDGPSRVGAFLGISLPLNLTLAAAAALALFRVTNAWDLPIYLCVTLAVVLARDLGEGRSLRWSVTRTALTLALVLAVCWLLSAPFNAHYQNHYSRIGWVHSHTPLRQLLVLWGVPLAFLAAYGVVALARQRGNGEAKVPWRHPLAAFAELPAADRLVLTLAACAIGLVVAPEVVYVRDIYGPEYYRANTYFKFGYQAFILFGVLVGPLAHRVLTADVGPRRRRVVRVGGVLILILPLLYPPFALTGYYGSLQPGRFRGLDGLAFLGRDGRGDGPAVRWLVENVSGSPVVLEANGDSFTEHGRVSMATGLPTILGWYAHEGLWRGSMDVPAERARAVSLVYESEDVARTLEVLREYGVRFVVIGDLERERFESLNEQKLLRLGDVVFEADGTRIIRVRP